MAAKKTTINEEVKTVNHRQFTGVVVSVAPNKTAHVLVKTTKVHPKYKKQFMTTRKYAVHDEKNEALVGQTAVFEECRPLSKTKKWRLISVK